METTQVTFEVNGHAVSSAASPKLTLLRFLRDELRLTGTRDGCSQGHCGSCMVLVDGKPTLSCVVKVGQMKGRRVETIEGISGNGKLHPAQEALIHCGAVQCGFCIPGMVISAKALLDKNHHPGSDEIKRALRLHLCRCGAYPRIIQAVQMAGRILAGEEVEMAKGQLIAGHAVGSSLPDKDGVERVTGQLQFADDIYLEGMLYGKVLWSQSPHAEVLGVDTEEAERMPGVEAVLTAKDVPGRNGHGLLIPHQPVLASDRVRFIGDPIAVVFADTPEQAEQALARIRVDYRELPGVFSPQEALEPGAPPIHEGGNLAKHVRLQVGDVEKGFRAADVIVEETYTTPFQEHAYLEPEAGVATLSQEGRIVLWYPSQLPFEDRMQVAASLGVAPERVRVISTPIGGAFGGKSEITIQVLLALGALRTGRPVKITLTRPESLRISSKRHPFAMSYKVGATKEGKLTAVEATLTADAGPYAGFSVWVMEQACIFSCGPYVIPNVKIDGYVIYTNNANSSALRGFGSNQVGFAMESTLDILARRLQIDPFELRLRNAMEVGSITISGEVLQASVPLKETLRRARAALEKSLPIRSTKRLGIGVASAFKNTGIGRGVVDDAAANVELTRDGHILLTVAATDTGQGLRTMLAQVASEVIGVDYDRVQVVTGDTDLVPRSGGHAAERQTFCAGNAVLYAARQFKEKVLAHVGRQYNTDPQGLAILGDQIVDAGRKSPLLTLAELGRFTAGEGEPIRADYLYTAPKTFPLVEEEDVEEYIAKAIKRGELARREDYLSYLAYAFTTQVAIVEVDDKTGEVKVRKVIVAQDVGRAINPQKIETQLESSTLLGMGYALTEEFRVEKGINLTNTLAKCRIPTFQRLPEVECIIVEDDEPKGPFGAKGMSEVATVPITPAIINAIHDAVGVRMTDLPATKERVLRGLKASHEGP